MPSNISPSVTEVVPFHSAAMITFCLVYGIPRSTLKLEPSIAQHSPSISLAMAARGANAEDMPPVGVIKSGWTCHVQLAFPVVNFNWLVLWLVLCLVLLLGCVVLNISPKHP